MPPELRDAASDWAAALAAVDGLTVQLGEELARHSTFQIGGAAEAYVEVAHEASLEGLLALVRQHRLPFQILGLGSNILFPDDGMAGVVARLGGEFRRLEIDGTRVTAGAALALAQVAKRAAQAGLAGLEALSGFPSTVGGAVYMNAGCYGTEIRDVLDWASLIDADGARRTVTADELEPGYRRTNLQGTATIVTAASFGLRTGDAAAALGRIDELNRKRRASLPSGVANAGSIFKNPPGDFAGRLIEECGLKGEERGAAQISPKHGNVIVNRGGARAADVLGLMLAAREAVRRRFAIDLVPEVVLAGSLADRWTASEGRS
jgi:UDP-N-acetylmuramate dehydrogenase